MFDKTTRLETLRCFAPYPELNEFSFPFAFHAIAFSSRFKVRQHHLSIAIENVESVIQTIYSKEKKLSKQAKVGMLF